MSVDVQESLSLQLSEVEMLQSMFPEELELEDKTSVQEIQMFVDGEIQYECMSARLGFSLKLDKEKLELVCHLPHEYPQVLPELYIRSSRMSRINHRLLSDSLQEYISDDTDRGELCIGLAAQWLQDHAHEYTDLSENKPESHKNSSKPKVDTTFCRMWIYSHHIYSKIKRKAILDFTEELRLTGFCMPGKPGILCIEGYNSHVEEFWHRIRRMQWKKLVMKEKEDSKIENDNMDKHRKFSGFEEMYFEARQSKGRGAHGDRGLLFQFLEQKGFSNIFPIYFGVEGKSTEHEDSD